MSVHSLFQKDIAIVNLGSPSFVKDFELQSAGYIHLDWKPIAGGKSHLIQALERIEPYSDLISKANEKAIHEIKSSEGTLISIERAADVIPNMDDNTILHAGPPIEFDQMAGPMKGAILGALVYEGKAKSIEEALSLAKSGQITFDSAHHHQAVGPMAGIISPSMPVHVLHDPIHDSYAYCTINEGLGKVLRYGANSKEVLDRLTWIEQTFAPVMKEAIQLSGGIDIKSIIAQALHMGDECHNRNKASSSLFLREISPYIIMTEESNETKKEVLSFIKNNEHYFLNLSMPFAKLSLDSARSVPYASVLTVMSRNGVDFGIQLASSNKWYTYKANYVQGLLFPGYTQEDAAPDIGDSAITETAGIGGFAMGGAPAIVQFVGGEVSQAFDYSKQMHEITAGEHQVFTLPTLDFMPTAVGIDILKVIEKNILPIINTGMAHKEAGVGQVGAGLVTPPIECFEQAIVDFADYLEEVNK